MQFLKTSLMLGSCIHKILQCYSFICFCGTDVVLRHFLALSLSVELLYLDTCTEVTCLGFGLSGVRIYLLLMLHLFLLLMVGICVFFSLGPLALNFHVLDLSSC